MKLYFPNFLQKLLVLMLLATLQVQAFSQDKKDQINTLMSAAHQRGTFNGNVLVMQGGKQIYQGSFGPVEANSTTRLTRQYRFNIGSIAKEFNAVAIMMLKEQNKLSLDDAISKYVPDLPGWADKVKIRHLLQYSSGIPNSKWKETKGDQDNLNNLKKVTELNFEPGTKYAYNNNDVFMQRLIVANVSGMSFNDFVMKKMLKPLGIKRAIIDPTPADPMVAKAYNNEGVEDNMTPPISGWTNLNIDDFYRWSEALNNFKLISPASTQEILVPFSPGNQTGLGKGTMKGNKLVSHVHDGTAANYQALLISEQDKGLTIILQTNNKQNNLATLSDAILQILK
jgi:CubicO group peptidase (beta-lactamase class C family)